MPTMLPWHRSQSRKACGAAGLCFNSWVGKCYARRGTFHTLTCPRHCSAFVVRIPSRVRIAAVMIVIVAISGCQATTDSCGLTELYRVPHGLELQCLALRAEPMTQRWLVWCSRASGTLPSCIRTEVDHATTCWPTGHPSPLALPYLQERRARVHPKLVSLIHNSTVGRLGKQSGAVPSLRRFLTSGASLDVGSRRLHDLVGATLRTGWNMSGFARAGSRKRVAIGDGHLTQY